MDEKPELMKKIEISPSCIWLDETAEDAQSLVRKMAEGLRVQGLVEPTFAEAVLDRELVFPTGLQFEDMAIALPHTDAEHVVKTAIAMAVLNKTVPFRAMGSETDWVDAKLVIMLAIKDHEDQVPFLKALIDAFQERGNLTLLSMSETAEQLIERFRAIV